MLAAWRPVAESNRSIRFCRPLTKSLIQPAESFTIWSFTMYHLAKAGAKVLLFFDIRKYLRDFLLFFIKKGSNQRQLSCLDCVFCLAKG